MVYKRKQLIVINTPFRLEYDHSDHFFNEMELWSFILFISAYLIWRPYLQHQSLHRQHVHALILLSVCVNARARKRCKGKQCNCNCPIVNVVISLIMFPIQLVLLSFCNCNWVWPSAFKLVNSASISYAILLLFVLQLHRFYGIIQAIWDNI